MPESQIDDLQGGQDSYVQPARSIEPFGSYGTLAHVTWVYCAPARVLRMAKGSSGRALTEVADALDYLKGHMARVLPESYYLCHSHSCD